MIGGGVIGLSTALRLAEMGAQVTLVEAGEVGSGTTGATFAWLNASNKTPAAYHLLNVSGLAEYSMMRHQFHDAPWLHLDGHVEWATSQRDAAWLDEKVIRLRQWGYPVEWLSPRMLALLEPELRVPETIERLLYSPIEGYVETAGLVNAMARHAIAAGATIRTGFRVVDLVTEGDHVRHVVGPTNERIETSAVIICAGANSARVARMLDVDLPMVNTGGLLTFTTPAPVWVRATVTTRDVNVRPDGGGRFCVQAIDLDTSVDGETPLWPIPPAAYEALDRARQILPGLSAAAVAAASYSVRPIPDRWAPARRVPRGR